MNGGSETDQAFDSAAAFALLGDSTRVAILEALAGSDEDATTFASLREQVGVEDSGRFNYHLGKLVDTFVEKSDDGYQLTFAGSRVVGAVYEGTYAAGDDVEPIAVDADCPACDAGLELAYADERVTIGCTDCEERVAEFGFPPGAIAGRESETLPSVLTSHMLTMLDRLDAGLCTNCSGPISPTFEQVEGTLVTAFDCDRCHTTATTSLASVLLTEPAVVAFHYDHGVDVRDTLPWALPWIVESEAEQVGESPPRYVVTGSLDGETLRVEVDDRLRVVEASRQTA
jgi:hypothetical protein